MKLGIPVLALFVLLLIPLADGAAQTKKAAPPKPAELVGVWIGFWEDGEFTRLDLRADFTGYCAYVAPPDFVTHQYGVSVYRVTKWSLEEWRLNLNLAPISSHDESIYLKGRADGPSLQLEIGGIDRKWKRHVVLRKESKIEISNSETKKKIEEAELK